MAGQVLDDGGELFVSYTMADAVAVSKMMQGPGLNRMIQVPGAGEEAKKKTQNKRRCAVHR